MKDNETLSIGEVPVGADSASAAGTHEGDAPDAPPVLLKVRDVARMLTVSTALVYLMVRSGELKAVRLRESVRIERQSVLELLAASRIVPALVVPDAVKTKPAAIPGKRGRGRPRRQK